MDPISNIDKIIYGVEDMTLCRKFFNDWGLKDLGEIGRGVAFETLEGSQIQIFPVDDESLPPAIEEGSTVRQVVWAVKDEEAMQVLINRLSDAGYDIEQTDDLVTCTDPLGVSLGFRVASRRNLDVQGSPTNAYGRQQRLDAPSPVYERAEPVRLSHVVFFTNNLEEQVRFYTELLGFKVSDSYPGEGVFMRCQTEGGHHDMFLAANPAKAPGLNHVSFMVRDLYEVFGGGINMDRLGWKTEIGPGRHPISSAMFWYVQCPAGAVTEYYADEDYLSSRWEPREFERTKENFAEWFIVGGIDSKTRNQADRANSD